MKTHHAVAIVVGLGFAALVGCVVEPVTGARCGASGDGCECTTSVDRSGNNDADGWLEGECRASQFDDGLCCHGETYDSAPDCACDARVCSFIPSTIGFERCHCARGDAASDAEETGERCDEFGDFAFCERPTGGWCTCWGAAATPSDDSVLVESCSIEEVGCLGGEEVSDCGKAAANGTPDSSGSGSDSGPDASAGPSTSAASGPGTCEAKEAGTTMAPCTVDSDCFSDFCDETGNPGPYCFVPQTQDLAAGRGIACTTDQDCIDVAPDLAARGATIKCHVGDPDIYDGCEFGCGG